MTVSQNCNCDGCRNFEKYIDILPKAIISFFDTLGVDLRKVAECCVYCKNDDITLLYGGFCHICGALIQGESAWIKSSDASSHYDVNLAYHIDDSFSVSFQEECLLIEEQFDAPVLQVEFEARIPWLLDTKNTY